MGSIYQAWDQVLNRDVAIKLLHPDPTPELVLRFQQEARAAASLEHRNIVRILDFGQLENGQLYLTMELVQGRSLDKILEIEGGLDPERARSLLIDIAEGLEHCHRHEILHRDVKPANVMIAGDPGHESARIVDFGIAKFVESESREAMSHTKAGGALGSPAFMSPEAAQGRELDRRSDIYSFGCLAFQVLSGKLPFEGESGLTTLMMQIDQPAPSLEAVCSGEIPRDLIALVETCLAKDPDSRFVSFAAVLEELRRDRDASLEASESPDQTEVAPARKDSRLLPVGAVILLLSCLAFSVFLLGQRQTSDQADTAEVAPESEQYNSFPKLDEEEPRLEEYKGPGSFIVQGHIARRPLEELRGRKDITYLQFKHDELQGQALRTIAGLRIRTLKLIECDVDRDTFAWVKQLPSLRELCLVSCEGIDTASLGEIAELPNLASLDLNNSTVDDSGLARLSKVTSLQDLGVRRCSLLTDASLATLARLPRLRRLRIDLSGIESGDTSGLTALEHLEELEVSRTPFAVISKLSLTSLSFYELEKIDGPALVKLLSETKIKNLSFHRCPTLDPTIADLLQRARPGLKIHISDK